MDSDMLDVIDRFVSGSEGNRLVVTIRPPVGQGPDVVAATIRSFIEHIKMLHRAYGPTGTGIMVDPKTRPDGRTIELVIRRMTGDPSSN